MTLLGDLLKLGFGIGFTLTLLDLINPGQHIYTSIVFVLLPAFGTLFTDKKILLLVALCIYLFGYLMGALVVHLGAASHDILNHPSCAHSLYTILF